LILTGDPLEDHLRQVKEGNKMNQKNKINQNNQKNPFWTVMIYMAADNNLDEAALRDLSEMSKAGSTDEVHPVKYPKGGSKAAFHRVHPVKSPKRGSKAAFHGVKILVQLDRAVDQKTRRFLITKGLRPGGGWIRKGLY